MVPLNPRSRENDSSVHRLKWNIPTVTDPMARAATARARREYTHQSAVHYVDVRVFAKKFLVS